MSQKKLLAMAMSVATVAAGVLLANYLMENVDAIDDAVSGSWF